MSPDDAKAMIWLFGTFGIGGAGVTLSWIALRYYNWILGSALFLLLTVPAALLVPATIIRALGHG